MRRFRGSAVVGAAMLGAAPALAHGDMAALALAQLFGCAIAVVFGVAAIGLGFLAYRVQRRPPATPGDVFRGGAVGVLAIVAFAIAGAGGAMSFERTPAIFGWLVAFVPALLAAQLFVSARGYKKIDAKALRVGSIVVGVIVALVAAFAAFALIVDAAVPG